MEFVRKVIDATEIQDIIDIPKSLVNKKVEILIFPLDNNKKKNSIKKKSLAGSLSQYANTNLIEKEENIWYEEAHE